MASVDFLVDLGVAACDAVLWSAFQAILVNRPSSGKGVSGQGCYRTGMIRRRPSLI